MNVFGSIYEYIKLSDDIGKPAALRLHLEGSSKCFWGGLTSICISLYMTFVIFTKGLDMVNFNAPYKNT